MHKIKMNKKRKLYHSTRIRDGTFIEIRFPMTVEEQLNLFLFPMTIYFPIWIKKNQRKMKNEYFSKETFRENKKN